MIKIFETIKKYILYILIILYPVFVFSFASTTYSIPKVILLTVLTGLAVIAWIAESIARKSIVIKLGKFDLSVLLIVAAYTASAILQTPNKMEAFFYPGVVTIVIASAIVYFLINQLDEKAKEGLTLSLIISGALLAIIGLFAQIGVLSKIPQLPAFVRDLNFNPMGGYLPAIIYIAVTLAVSAVFIIKKKDPIYKLFAGVAAAVMILGLIVLIKNVLPGQVQSPKLPSFYTSWQIGVDTIKVSPFLGIGPANYLTAFNKFKPVAYNSTDLWQLRFTTATDYYLTVLTELGFAGLAAFIVLFVTVYRLIVKKFDLKFVPLLITLILFAAFPIIPILITLLFIVLAGVSESENKSVSLLAAPAAKSAVVLVCLPIVVALSYFYFLGSKWVLAESSFIKALDAIAVNNAKDTYGNMVIAINQNPYVDRYHASLAQVDLALAQSIANKKDLTDTDKSTITQLVQESINEGKSAVTLNPDRSGNWEILGQVYRSIMPFATGADQFTIQTFNQAVNLDPISPDLRISLGGVYYALGRYDDAIDAFKLAVLAKPDVANSHYNLAVAYQAKKDFDNAIIAMKNVVSLVPKDSQDFTLAQNALAELEKQKPAKVTAEGQNLTAPEPIAPSNVKPPITLPEEATPPATIQ